MNIFSLARLPGKFPSDPLEAIADFLFILNLPIIIQQRLQGNTWTMGPGNHFIDNLLLLLNDTLVVCYLHKIAITINFIISIGLLTLLSVDRYIVLVRNAWQNIRVKQRPPRIGNCF